MWHFLTTIDTLLTIAIIVVALVVSVASIHYGAIMPFDDPYYWDDEDESGE